MLGRTVMIPPRDDSTLSTSFLYTHHMLRQWRCSCGNLDSRRGCGIFWRKWSCVFPEGEIDKFPQIGGRG